MTDFRSFVPVQRFQPTIALSPDGSQVAYCANTSGQYNVWVHEVAGGPARQLTSYTADAVRRVAWSPDGGTLVYAADHHGNEQYDLFLIPAGGGPAEQLTDAPDRQFDLAREPFSADGRYLLFSGNDRDERCKDLIVHELATGRQRRFETEPGLWGPVSISPDGRWLLALRAYGNADLDVQLLDLQQDQPQFVPLTAHQGEVANFPGPWLPDSSGFLLRTDAGREFLGLSSFSLADRSTAPIAAPAWDVEAVLSSRDGSVLVWSVNEAGLSRLHVRRDGAELPAPELPQLELMAMDLSADGSRLAALAVGAPRPADVVVVDLTDGQVRYLTDSRPPLLQRITTVEPELVAYPTHDGRDVPAWFYRPAGAQRFPVVLSVHGGPEAQERPAYSYSGLYQFLLSRGIGVLAPNIRGSNGYGKSYQKLILRDWGGDELGDLEHAALYLQGRDDVDSDRIAVFGGSFGGFAALSCLSRLPKYWAAGVSVVGPSNLVTLAKSVPPTWRPMMRAWVGDPDDEADFLMSRSPISYADQITAPLMVIQGANDPRVAKAESDQIVAALRGRGVEVRYDVYDDEGHGFTNRDNEIRAMDEISGFLVGHLAG